MSNVTTVLISTQPEPREVRTALEGPIGGQQLRSLDDEACLQIWGGAKHPEASLWGAGFNHLDRRALFRHLEAIPWTHPRAVQVFVMSQESPKFGVFEMRDGHLVPINVEAGVQVVTAGVRDLVDRDGAKVSEYLDARVVRVRTSAEVDAATDKIADLLQAERNDMESEVAWLTE